LQRRREEARFRELAQENLAYQALDVLELANRVRLRRHLAINQPSAAAALAQRQMAEVAGVDPHARVVFTRECTVAYDYLVLATGIEFMHCLDDVYHYWFLTLASRLPCFSSSGALASRQASKPPYKGCTFLKPCSISSCATRALDASFGQVQ
jgi:hypothetical protein